MRDDVKTYVVILRELGSGGLQVALSVVEAPDLAAAKVVVERKFAAWAEVNVLAADEVVLLGVFPE